MHCKLKTWMNFHGQDIQYYMHSNAAAVLKNSFIYKQGRNFHPEVYIVETKYSGAKSRCGACRVIQMMMEFLRYKGGMNRCTKDKIFVT